MYQVENGFTLPNGSRWNPEYYQELMEGRISSSKQAKNIFEYLRREDVLPDMNHFHWAMLCISYCFAKGIAYDRQQIQQLLQTAPIDSKEKGVEIPSFKTCFQNHARLWLVILSDALFRLHPGKPATKADLYRYIQDLWHIGAMYLNSFWGTCRKSNPNSHLAARQMFMGELSRMAENNVQEFRQRLGHTELPETETGTAPQPAPHDKAAEAEKLLQQLRDLSLPVENVRFELEGVRDDVYRAVMSDFVKLGKILEPLCSSRGTNSNLLHVSQYADGTAHNYQIKIRRPENTWKVYGKEELDEAILRYNKAYRLPICLGLGEDGNGMFADVCNAPHLLVGGTSGAGKSVLVHAMMYSLLKLTEADLLEVAFLDPAAEYTELAKNYPNIWSGGVIGDRDEMKNALFDLVEEMNSRLGLLQEYEAKNIEALPEGVRPKYLVVLLDELAGLLDRDRSAETPLNQLLQEGRKVGMHVIAVTQEPDSDTFSSRLRANLGSRIALRVVKPGSSKMILDEAGAEKLSGQGDHLVKWNGQPVVFLHGYLI